MPTLILRPNGAGAETAINIQEPSSGNHYDKIDESVANDNTDFVYTDGASYLRDLFTLPAHGISGQDINSITIYVRTLGGYCKVSQRSGTTTTDGSEQTSGTVATWVTRSQTYTENPATSAAYTLSELTSLQIGVAVKNGNGDSYGRCTQVYVEVDYGVAPTVTTQAATSVAATSCTGNGNITDDGGGVTRRGFCYTAGVSGDPTTSDSVAYDDGTFTAGAYTKAITGLTAFTAYRIRAYAVNDKGTSYGTTLQLPAAPTDVTATKGDHTDKVVVSWTETEDDGASGFRVLQDDVDVSGVLGLVATYNDTDADPPVITPGEAIASKGKHYSYVRLTLSGVSIVDGTTHVYKVRAVADGGDSADSNTDSGWRGYGAMVYQWQKSAADSDASYSNITGAKLSEYNDAAAPAYGSGGRYYKCLMTASGAANATTTADRGYRRSSSYQGQAVTIQIKNPAGETLAFLPYVSAPGYSYRINELGDLTFNLPGDDPARALLVRPNEAWLSIDGVLIDQFKITRVEKTR